MGNLQAFLNDVQLFRFDELAVRWPLSGKFDCIITHFFKDSTLVKPQKQMDLPQTKHKKRADYPPLRNELTT